jgi:hypothetical protein
MKLNIWHAAFLAILSFGLNVSAARAEWKQASGPLMTRWDKEVTPENVHKEYPRPQMVRPEWLNLNGLWDYAITPITRTAPPENFVGQILVPFPIESALSGVMKRLDENSVLWYRRSFTVPKEWAGRQVKLHFGAVDYHAMIFVNGKSLGYHTGGYDGFTFDVTEAIKGQGPQELVVEVIDPTEGNQPRGKQSRNPRGIFYTPTSGIWQTVWLEPVAEVAIDGLKITPDVDGGALKLKVKVNATLEAGHVEAVALADGKEVARISGPLNAEVVLPIKNAKLWSPGQPFLYDLKVSLFKGNQRVDEVKSYFGMRKIAIQKDEQGINRIMLNNKFVFQVGTLDQGFWPDGLYTAPTDEALRYDLEVLKKLGFNMTRKHVKVEPERWYYWCDKMGLLVWQDMPSGNNKTDESKKEYESELRRLVDGRYNHPCIVTWVVFNEGWGQYDTERLTAATKAMDPSRIVNNASGWFDGKCGDLIDMHKYPGPGSPEPETNRAAVLGEFGGLGLGLKGHTWAQENWGYQGMADQDKLTEKYLALLSRAWGLKDEPGLSAVVYTQTTDVETECNGLMTYDRAVIKVNPEKGRAANLGELPAARYVVVLPDAQQDKVMWRYTVEKPSDDWSKVDFDASGWKEARGGFGTKGTPGALVKTEWKTDDIWLQRKFTLGEGKLMHPTVQMHHDEDAEVYINGVLAVKAAGFAADYDDYEIDPAAVAVLKPGTNIISVHCHQTTGGQYIDVGILAEAPVKK